jgi:branched-chain amino acid transport system permease protein
VGGNEVISTALTPSSVLSRLKVPTRSQIIWTVIVVAALSWSLGGTYNTFTATSAVTVAIVLLGVGVVAGDAGMATLCQIAFAAVSAWAFMKFGSAGHPLPIAIEIVISVLTATGLGLLFALPALRLRSVNLAVVTLGMGMAVETFLVAQTFPVASNGIDRPFFAASDGAFFAFCLFCFAVIAILLEWARRSPLGGTWQSVKNSERATAAMGYSVTWAKLSAFGVGSTIAGVSGILTVMLIGVADVTTFPSILSLILFAVGIFIGSWRWQGALFAGVASVAIPEVLKSNHLSLDFSNLLFGLGAVQALAGGTAIADVFWPRRVAAAQEKSRTRNVWADAIAAADSTRSIGSDAGIPVMSVRDLSVHFGGVVAVDGVSFGIGSREILGLIGANGAGKTSLVDAATGFWPYGGTVELSGKPLSGSPQSRARAGLRRTFQQDRVTPTLTAERYLRMAARHKLSPVEMELYLAFAGIDSKHVLVGSLEGAARRLLEVAGAFASNPVAVLLDEPVAGLSAAEALHFASRLVQAPVVFGSSVLVIEHDVDFVRAVCSRTIVLDFGRVIAQGKPEDVLREPVVRTAYLGQVD